MEAVVLCVVLAFGQVAQFAEKCVQTQRFMGSCIARTHTSEVSLQIKKR